MTARRRRPALVTVALLALTLAFFGVLTAHPGRVLYADASDLLGLHIPQARFLIGSWRATGELPLWCPHRFSGSPFLHDIQVGAFYPPHLILYLLPDAAIGPALSWLVAAHVFGAGLAMYAYARSRGLLGGGSAVAALGFMFAGKWMFHLLGAGHYMATGLAWLPIVLLLAESALGRRSLLRAAWAGAAFAVLALGTHPQWTLYAGLFLACWTAGAALETGGYWEIPPCRPARAMVSLLACGVLGATVALLLLSAQLLPALEAAREGTRDAQGVSALAPDNVPMTALSLIGPPAAALKGFEDWEYRGGLGVLWACAATLGALAARGRARLEVISWLGLVAFALGGSLLVRDLPGFRLFAFPSRMLLLATLPTALFAGRATDALFGPAGSPTDPDLTRRGRIVLALATLAALASFGGLALLNGHRSVRGHPYWIALLVMIPAASALLGRRGEPDARPRRQAALAWSALLLLDLWAMAWPHVRVRPESDVFARPASVRFLAAHRVGHGRILDRHLPGQPTRTPVSPPLALMLGLDSVRGYNPMDILRYRRYLQRIAGDDGPVPPFRQVLNFPILRKPLLDLLGVRYLVEPTDPTGLPADSRPPSRDPRWRRVLDEPRPITFNIFAGTRPLPPYTVFENLDAFPRAFVVPHIAPQPLPSRLSAAMATTDFRRHAFLDGYPPNPSPTPPNAAFRPATILESLPNRVRVVADSPTPGALILTDPWFPGWTATLDGRPTRLYRANDLFRGIAFPAGRHEVDFRFDPDSFRIGRALSLATLASLMIVSLLSLSLRRRIRPCNSSPPHNPDEPPSPLPLPLQI